MLFRTGAIANNIQQRLQALGETVSDGEDDNEDEADKLWWK